MQPDWWHNHAPHENGLCASPLSCNNHTGFLYTSEFSTNSVYLFTTVCTVQVLPTWQAGFPQKSENRIPWLVHDWFASFHDSHSHMVSDMVMIASHNMHDNHKLESCHSHENKQFHDFSMTFWEIFIFQDFSMTFHDSNFFQDFPWPWEAWQDCCSTTLGTVTSTGLQQCSSHSASPDGKSGKRALEWQRP